jgi:hypothetical protein
MIAKFITKGICHGRIKVGRNGGKREKHFLLSMQEVGVKILSLP